MNCLDYQHNLQTEPHRPTTEMQAHAQSCAACAAWTQQMHAFDAGIKRALQINVPPAREPSLPRSAMIAPRRFALAASVLGAIALATLGWFWFPRATLAAEVIEHVELEPQSWVRRDSIPQAALDGVLKRSGVSAHFAPGSVTYAQNCWFRGHLVPHLVVRDARGAVTVLLLAAEQVSAKASFDEDGYRGVILPVGKGSIAVLARDEMRVEEVADQMLQALRP